MHFGCVVIYRKHQDPEKLLAKHRGQWDWYQVGGRYTGFFTGYDPQQDPANQRDCPFCDAEGMRVFGPSLLNTMIYRFPDRYNEQSVIPPEGVQEPCNACNGTKKQTEWPTNWVPHEGDDQPIENWPDERASYRTITANGNWTTAWPEEALDAGQDATPEQMAVAAIQIRAWKVQYAGCRVRIYDLHY